MFLYDFSTVVDSTACVISRISCVDNVFEPSAWIIPSQKHTHAHTHPYQGPHSSILQKRRRWLGSYHCCCFSPQVSVAHSYSRPPAACIIQLQMAAARGIDDILLTAQLRLLERSRLSAECNATNNVCSFGGSGPSPTRPTRLNESSSPGEARVARGERTKHRASSRL